MLRVLGRPKHFSVWGEARIDCAIPINVAARNFHEVSDFFESFMLPVSAVRLVSHSISLKDVTAETKLIHEVRTHGLSSTRT